MDPRPAARWRDLPSGSDTLRWGIVGASRVARAHGVEAIRTQPPSRLNPPQAGAQIRGIYSHSLARARRFADECQIPFAVDSLAGLLDMADLDCLYVAGHPRHHADAVLAGLEAGLHILVEPPLALSPGEAAQAVALAAERQRVLAVNHVLRAGPAIQALRSHLAESTIGELIGGYLCNGLPLPLAQQSWRLRRPGGGVILDRSLRSLDLLTYVTQEPPATLQGDAVRLALGVDVPDHAVVTVKMAGSRALIQVCDSYVMPHAHSHLTLYGTLGTLRADNCFLPDQAGTLTLTRHGRASPIPLLDPQPHFESVRRFQQSVRSGDPPLASGAEEADLLQRVASQWPSAL